MIPRGKFYDGAAIAASVACLIHCLALPIIAVLIPTLASYVALPESFHLAAFLFAVPTSAVALTLGYRHHGHLCPVGIATVGLVLIALGATIVAEQAFETLVTVVGALGLAIGHALNWRAWRLR